MTEPASVRSAGLDQPAGDEPCLDVSASEWVGATRELVSQGFTFFDWLTAVDETDGAEDAGFDVVLHLLDVSTPGALRGHLLRTRIPEGSALPSLTRVFAGAAWHERETHEMFGIDVDGFDDGTGLEAAPAAPAGGLRGNAVAQVVRPRRPGLEPWPGPRARRGPRRAEVARAPARAGAGVPPPEWGPR